MLDAPNKFVNYAELPICDDVRMTELDERLRECLREKGAKPIRLAEATGATRATVSEWLSGDTQSISPKYLFPAAEWLGVLPTWLNTGKGPKRLSDVQEEQGSYDHISPEIIDLARKIQAAPENVQQGIRLILEPETETKTEVEKRQRYEPGRAPKGEEPRAKKQRDR